MPPSLEPCCLSPEAIKSTAQRRRAVLPIRRSTQEEHQRQDHHDRDNDPHPGKTAFGWGGRCRGPGGAGIQPSGPAWGWAGPVAVASPGQGSADAWMCADAYPGSVVDVDTLDRFLDARHRAWRCGYGCLGHPSGSSPTGMLASVAPRMASPAVIPLPWIGASVPVERRSDPPEHRAGRLPPRLRQPDERALAMATSRSLEPAAAVRPARS